MSEAFLVPLGDIEGTARSLAADPEQEAWLDEPRAILARQLAMLEASERIAAWAHAQGLAALGGLKVATEWEVERRVELVSGSQKSAEELDSWSRDALIEEVIVATGWSETDLLRRLDLAENTDGRASVLLARFAAGETTLSRAMADRVLSPAEDGVPTTHQRLTRELRRQLALAGPDREREHEHALARRTAHAEVLEDGTGQLTITGDGARVVAAMERLDTLARALRADGDERNLAALRADLALDLLSSGWPDRPDYAGIRKAPPAHVNLTVSLASLVGAGEGVGEIPGYGFVPAERAWEIALAEGSIWRRIVTDPLTGAVLDIGTHRYRPSRRMREAAAVLDGTCRGPGCTQRARTCDLDHQVAWPMGETRLTNLIHKHRRHHNLKTRRLWTCDEAEPGVLRWEPSPVASTSACPSTTPTGGAPRQPTRT